MKKYCNYCNQWIEVVGRRQFCGHRGSCKQRPGYKESKLKEWETKTKRKPKLLFCELCNKGFYVNLTKHEYVKRKKPYSRFCSYKCSNSHTQTLEQNEARCRKLTKYKYETRVCKLCKEKFEVKQNQNNIFCSRFCSGRNAGLTFLEGKYPSNATIQWYEYGDIKVRGTYELRTCYILDQMKEIGEIKDWDYTNDRFQYVNVEGDKRGYIVDFKVFSRTIEYIEVKGRIVDNDRLKWKAVRDAGYKLDVWTLDKIIEYEKLFGILVIGV